MNIEGFMRANGLKNARTVRSWLENGLIPGALVREGEWDIPELARPPYTKARAKTAEAVYVSIIEATNGRKGVCAKLYNMPEEEFSVYIENLEKEGLISVREEGGVRYCYATPDSIKFIGDRNGLEKLIKKLSPVLLPIVQTVVTAAAQGAVTAIASKQ